MSANIKDSNHVKSAPAPERRLYPEDSKFEERPPVNSVLDAIGHTPMVKLNKIPKDEKLECEIYVKCEYENPGGSVKDRIAVTLIEALENDPKNHLNGDSVIVVPTSGNTGIGIALVCALKGYQSVIVMPDEVSEERKNTVRLLGGTVVLCPTGAPPNSRDSVYQTAVREAGKHGANGFLIDQFSDDANPDAHRKGTAVEILAEMHNKVDMVVMGVGSGGTITGVAETIKAKCPDCVVVGVDPVGSTFAVPDSTNHHKGQFHEVEGIGGATIPEVLKRKLVDVWVKTEDQPSLEMARRLCKQEGLLCGGSSGAAVWAAIQVASRELKPHQKCVVILPDSIRNYMTKFVTTEWMESRRFQEIVPNPDIWWWDSPMPTTIYNDDLQTISEFSDVKTALTMLHEDGKPVIAVIDDQKDITGVISAEYVRRKMNHFSQSTLDNAEYTLDMITTKRFLKVDLQNPPKLGLVSRMLNVEPFVIVVDSDHEKNSPKGYITTKEILHYIIRPNDK